MEIEFIIETAKELLQKRGKHLAQMFFVYGKRLEIAILDFDDDTKPLMREKMRKYVEQNKPDKYFFVTEAWMKKLDPTKESYRRPSECPDRIECLLIMEFRKDMKNKTIMIPFKRKGKEIIFEKKMDMEKNSVESVSYWNFYLEREGVEEKINNFMKKVKNDETTNKEKIF